MALVWTWREIDLEPGPGAGHEARSWLGFTFDLRGPSAIDAEIALSEVVAHAVRAGDFGQDDTVWVTADRPPGALHVEVVHPGKTGDVDDADWVHVLEDVAAVWGVVDAQDRVAIWFEIPLAGTGRELVDADDTDLIERMTIDSRAGDELISRYDPLIRRMVSRYRRAGLEIDDLVQVGREALLGAADRFQSSKGSFERFASRTVSGTVKKHLRDSGWSVRPPRSLQELVLEIRGAEQILTQTLGRAPTPEELAEETGHTPEEVGRARRAAEAFDAGSLDQPIDEGGDPRIDRMGSTDSAVARAPSWAAVDSVLHVLDEREQEIVRLRYFEDLTQREIAERIGISQMHVSRLLRASVEEMREAIGVSS